MKPSPGSVKGVFMFRFQSLVSSRSWWLEDSMFCFSGTNRRGSGESFPVKLTVSVLCPKEGRHSCVLAVRGDTDSARTQASQWY